MSTDKLLYNEVKEDAILPTSPALPQVSAENLARISPGLITADFGNKARGYLSVNQTVATASNVKIQFDMESYDGSDNFADARFTVEVPGWYFIFTKIYMSGLGDGRTLTVTIQKNGSIFSQSKMTNGASADAAVFNSDTLRLNKGDYIETYINHNQGTDRTADAGEGQSFLLVHLIS
jgi:hypothetical protein